MSLRYIVDSAHQWNAASSSVTPPENREGSANFGTPDLEAVLEGLLSETNAEKGPNLLDWLGFLRGDSSRVFESTTATRPEAPVLHLPDHYEPRYAYPLLIWVQAPGAHADGEFRRVMDGISDRNYLGLAFRPSVLAKPTRETAPDFGATLTQEGDRLARLVSQVRKSHLIHNERVFLLGSGLAGTWGLQFGLQRPEWFAGIGAFCSPWPTAKRLLGRYRAVRGKRVLLGSALRGGNTAQVNSSKAGARLLHAAGMTVCQRRYASSGEIVPAMLSDINRWVMREMYAHLAVV